MVTWAVSLITQAKTEEQLKGTVHSLTPKRADAVWWKRPEAMAAAILLAALALGAFFA